MTYVPSDTERLQTAFIQLASLFFYFVPGLIVRRSKLWISPYVRFWIKGNTIWSLALFAPVAFLLILGLIVDMRGPIVVAWAVHAIMTIMCAFASMFNRPVGYFIVSNQCCMTEMAEIYGAALSPTHDDDD